MIERLSFLDLKNISFTKQVITKYEDELKTLM
jgi:hypothetical protein